MRVDAYAHRSPRPVEYAACGECPKGKCDGCRMCDYFVDLGTRNRGPAGRLRSPRPAPGSGSGTRRGAG